MRNTLKFALILLSCFLGSFAASALFTATPLSAKQQNSTQRDLTIMGENGNRAGYFGPGRSNQGTFFLFNENGELSVQMGSYETGGERGQSLFGLHGKNGALRMLLRLHGADDSPTLIFKDKRGADKIIIGLKGQDERPYFSYEDSKGQMRDLFLQ